MGTFESFPKNDSNIVFYKNPTMKLYVTKAARCCLETVTVNPEGCESTEVRGWMMSEWPGLRSGLWSGSRMLLSVCSCHSHHKKSGTFCSPQWCNVSVCVVMVTVVTVLSRCHPPSCSLGCYWLRGRSFRCVTSRRCDSRTLRCWRAVRRSVGGASPHRSRGALCTVSLCSGPRCSC